MAGSFVAVGDRGDGKSATTRLLLLLNIFRGSGKLVGFWRAVGSLRNSQFFTVKMKC
jgi:hypothetical protein